MGWKTSGNLCIMYPANAIKKYLNVCCFVSFILKGCCCIPDTFYTITGLFPHFPEKDEEWWPVFISWKVTETRILGDIIKISIGPVWRKKDSDVPLELPTLVLLKAITPLPVFSFNCMVLIVCFIRQPWDQRVNRDCVKCKHDLVFQFKTLRINTWVCCKRSRPSMLSC